MPGRGWSENFDDFEEDGNDGNDNLGNEPEDSGWDREPRGGSHLLDDGSPSGALRDGVFLYIGRRLIMIQTII
jgi:hypothetical protein